MGTYRFARYRNGGLLLVLGVLLIAVAPLRADEPKTGVKAEAASTEKKAADEVVYEAYDEIIPEPRDTAPETLRTYLMARDRESGQLLWKLQVREVPHDPKIHEKEGEPSDDHVASVEPIDGKVVVRFDQDGILVIDPETRLIEFAFHWRTKTETCGVHQKPLRDGLVPVRYGLVVYPGDYYQAQRERFPHAELVINAGCIVGPIKTGLVRYCDDCRVAAREWQAEQEKIREQEAKTR